MRKEGLYHGKRKILLIVVLILLGIGFILAFAVMWIAIDRKTPVPSVSGSPTKIERAEIIVTQSPTKTAEGEDQPTITPGISQDSTNSEISGELNSAIEGDISLWHAYQSGSTEESVLSALIKNAQDHFPDLRVNVLQIPASEIVRDYQIDVIDGRGPDLFLAPNISLCIKIVLLLQSVLMAYSKCWALNKHHLH